MRIDRVYSSNIAAARRRERVSGKDSESFRTNLKEGAEKTANVSGNAPINPLTGILAAQEVEDSTQGRSRGLRRGYDLLDRLEDLRLGLVMGTLSLESVEKLAHYVALHKEKVNDPALAELLNEIEIRAAVEIAKLGR